MVAPDICGALHFLDLGSICCCRTKQMLSTAVNTRPFGALTAGKESTISGRRQPPNRLTSLEPLAVSICCLVNSLPTFRPFVMRLLLSAAACLSLV
ncbi:hypothetical protein SAMN05216573_10979 [Bradyrhizobium sp. Rc3b]|nr:hypothetical protein SAMN05216573_10979 [Bradyrhizobium sp. Rc3b]